MHGRSRKQFFHSNVYIFKRKQNERQTINMLSLLRNRPDIILVPALKVHFDIYVCDCLLVNSLITSRLVSL